MEKKDNEGMRHFEPRSFHLRFSKEVVVSKRERGSSRWRLEICVRASLAPFFVRVNQGMATVSTAPLCVCEGKRHLFLLSFHVPMFAILEYEVAPLTATLESSWRNADRIFGTTGEAEIVRSRAHRLFLFSFLLILSLFHLAQACVFTPDNALVIFLTALLRSDLHQIPTFQLHTSLGGCDGSTDRN